VVRQLQTRPYYLYLYFDALFDKDSQLAMEYAERQVGSILSQDFFGVTDGNSGLCSSPWLPSMHPLDLWLSYDRRYTILTRCAIYRSQARRTADPVLVKAYRLCRENDMVPEMVYLLGKVGDNKNALKLIIERLDDVKRVRALSELECVAYKLTSSTYRQLISRKRETTMNCGKTYSSTQRQGLVRTRFTPLV
jgi:hypothetical protein